ncbi:hypothetical protein AX16_003881 [Volvariella volvacea WC 439]|nr:hypothetical protein AX16_003881 [Volvariella volvacea WC 439]
MIIPTPMQSQTTLVQGSGQLVGIAPERILHFDRDSFTNARVMDDQRRIVYDIKSDRDGYKTKVYEGEHTSKSDDPFITIAKSEIFADKLKLRGQEPVKIKNWLSGGDGVSWFSFMHEGTRYIWRASGTYQVWFFPDTDVDNPIAWYQPSRKVNINGEVRPIAGYLALKGKALEMIQIVLASYLLVAQKIGLNRRRLAIGEGQALAGMGDLATLYYATKR